MALAIDGSAHVLASGTTPTITLTTTQTNDIIILTSRNNSVTISSVVGATIGSFTQISHNTNGAHGDIWACFSSAALTSEVVTVTIDNAFNPTFDIFGVSGSNQTSLTGAFDAGGPQVSASSPIGITTVNANTMVIGIFGIIIVPNVGAGTNYTAVPNSDNDFLLTEYRVLSSTSTESVGTAGDGLIHFSSVIAIVQASGGGGDVLRGSQQRLFM
jgi:hypothetical protein